MTIRISREVIKRIPPQFPEITLIRVAPAEVEFVAETNKIVAYLKNRTIVWHLSLVLDEELPSSSPTLPTRPSRPARTYASITAVVAQQVLRTRSF